MAIRRSAELQDAGITEEARVRRAGDTVRAARYRLGPEPLCWLFSKTSAEWNAAAPDFRWKDLRLFGVDGTTLRVPDSDANFERFGKPGGRNGKGDAGYPQVRACCLMDLGSRLLVDASFDAYATSEHHLASKLWDSVPPQSLTILDRGFVNFAAFADLLDVQSGRHFMVRMRANLRVIEEGELDDGSVLAELPADRGLLRHRPGLPRTIRGRVIAYQHPDGQPCRLFVTLLDHEKYPASELVELYHDRWEIELAYDELKTHMLQRREALRSKKPDGVAQELWGLLTLHNLVRYEMIGVAVEHQKRPRQVSFTMSLMLMRTFWEVTAWRSAAGAVPKYLREFRTRLGMLILPERRSERRYPRHVKIKMSNYRRNRGRRIVQAEKSPK